MQGRFSEIGHGFEAGSIGCLLSPGLLEANACKRRAAVLGNPSYGHSLRNALGVGKFEVLKLPPCPWRFGNLSMQERYIN